MCTTDGCFNGFSLQVDDNTCIENECTCNADTGYGAKGSACLVHGDAVCASCKSGFGLGTGDDATKCVETACTCDNGSPVTGDACSSTSNGEKCSSCNLGFTLQDSDASCK
jgi:hypothetical protein